jgi:hypothetical protein
MVELKAPREYLACAAQAIDNKGRILGSCNDEFGPHHVIVWTR